MKGKAGFTLVEVTVALVILAAVSALSYQMLIRAQSAFQSQRDLVETQQNARMAMESITGDLRQISYGKDPTQPSVVFASLDSIVFVADLFDSVPGAEMVAIYLTSTPDSGTLNPSDRIVFRTVWDTAGAEVITGPIAYGVADSGLTFTYFDREGDHMSFPIVQPEHVSEVEVAITAQTAHAVAAGNYLDVTSTTTVFPRNLPFTPPMPRPESPGCGNLSSPNCESLTLTWTRPTTNTDGSELLFNDISHYSVYYGTRTDSMKLDTRLARNLDTWTVKNLTGGLSYYVDVTVTSLAGVESYPCRRNGTVGSSAPPKSPANFQVGGGIGAISLNWSPVTEDTLDAQITAEVSYRVYREETAGFTPSISNLVVAELIDTSYTDFLSDSCAHFFYLVTAEACGMEGGRSSEQAISLPAAASCPPTVLAYEGSNPGEVGVIWSPPTTRTDATSLSSGDISGYRLFWGLATGYYTDSMDVGTTPLDQIISGLQDCSTYYVNLAAIDACGTRGVVCPGRESAARTSAPCNEYVPEPVASLALTAGDQRMDLAWPANLTDCDLAGYNVYYGSSPGLYDGTGATQGPSPVFVDASVAHQDTVHAVYTLSGLDACTEYSIMVQCVDVCDPPHLSEGNATATDMTYCGTCDIVKACVTEIAEGSGQRRIRYQIANDGEVDLDVDQMDLVWGSAAGLTEILVGGSSVWKEDGSAGEDPTGTQGSPAEIDIDDFTLGEDEDFGHPRELTLVFNGSMTGDVVDVTYHTQEGTCTNTLSPCGILLDDDFTQANGSPIGWTPRTGTTWRVTSNVLQTTSSSRITPDAIGFSMSDYTVTARMRVESGSSTRRVGVYVRYRDTGTYYLLRYYPGYDLLEFRKKVNFGGLDLLGYTYDFDLDNGVWYTLTVAAYGNSFRCWVDGVPIEWEGIGPTIHDGSIATGNVCLYAWDIYTAYFDDVVVEPTCGCGGMVP
ncbi:MAG: prepilin-type N-terminal cleavage/methylation domain-containing protein [Candidatus Eisenbacteria bacterium]|nr:prepilin-type N-terminal cleavage/methylation domain-containing protein [Candidatus Eisenbacteria bacterium]